MLTSCFLGIKSALFLERVKGVGWGDGGGGDMRRRNSLLSACEEGDNTELQSTRNEGIVVGSFLNLT